MNTIAKIFSIMFCCWALSSCVDSMLKNSAQYDSRRFTVQLLSLFNQRVDGKVQSWKGNWLFRRERLNILDRGLKDSKSDLIIFQDVMGKQQNPFDFDRAILGVGSLKDYEWQMAKVFDYKDTFESEYAAVVTGLPLRFPPQPQIDRKQMWRIGRDGYLSIFSARNEGQDILIFNIKIPDQSANHKRVFSLLKAKARLLLKDHRYCKRRVIFAGYFPGQLDDESYMNFTREFNLVDASNGFCERESDCYTATPLNDLYRFSHGDVRPRRSDRILLHKSTIVYTSERNFHKESLPDSLGRKLKSVADDEFAFETKAWATDRAGWITRLRFARCD